MSHSSRDAHGHLSAAPWDNEQEETELAMALRCVSNEQEDVDLAMALSRSLQDVPPTSPQCSSRPRPQVPVMVVGVATRDAADMELGLALSASLQDAPPHTVDERDAMQTCELCFDNISPSSGRGMTCPNGHFVCAGCAPSMVQTFLERVNESDTLLEQHRARGGHIPCFRNTSAFDPRCTAVLSDGELARTLSDEIFVRYRESQNEVVENRIWQDHNERFRRKLARIQSQHQIESGRRGDEASAEFMRRQYPNARMCPICQFGPVINENCADLQAHNGEARSGGRSRINNACGRCGFFHE